MSLKVRLEPIINKSGLDPKKYLRAIENAGNESAKAVQVDFKVTTRTWKHQPDFRIEHSSGRTEWQVGTDDEIYRYVSEGTRAHIIKPRNKKRLVFFRSGFRPKSRKGWIGSNKGRQASKDLTAALTVHHPGNEAREFVEAIGKKWDEEWPRQIDRALRAAERYG